MSAWLLSNAHIDAIVAGAIRVGVIDQSEATKTGRMLRNANIKSIEARYGDSRKEMREGFGGAYYFVPARIKRRVEEGKETDAQLYVHVSCYDYQTCEFHGYETSTAARFVGKVKRALAARGITNENARLDPYDWAI